MLIDITTDDQEESDNGETSDEKLTDREGGIGNEHEPYGEKELESEDQALLRRFQRGNVQSWYMNVA